MMQSRTSWEQSQEDEDLKKAARRGFDICIGVYMCANVHVYVCVHVCAYACMRVGTKSIY